MKKNTSKKIILSEYEKQEIERMVQTLESIKNDYNAFNSFVKSCDDALKVASALLNDNYKDFKKYQLKYTNHTAQKMKGMQSLSTYKKVSPICNYLSQHKETGCICEKCYADNSLKLYKASLIPALIYNTLLLKYIDIDNAQIPYINSKYFRFESFSDLQGSKHFKNLLQVCKKNKNTLFTLWTKAGSILKSYMEKESINKLPNNLNIIHSECFINKNYFKVSDLELLEKTLNTKNKIKCFIVYDDEQKRKVSGFYQCKNKCIDCLKCYKKTKNNIFIAEKLH